MEQSRKHSRKRDAILACLRMTDAHPSADWIYRQLKPEIPDLSLGTVYRNLAYFADTGEIKSLGSVGGQERFDGDVRPHSHFICRDCGAVLDWPEEETGVDTENVEETLGVRITEVDLRYSGLCGECLKKNSMISA